MALALVLLHTVSLPATAQTGVVSVLDYGARGDGIADDTAAIERALADNPVVTFPSGRTFAVANLSVPSDRRLLGYGATLRLLPGQLAMTSVVDLGKNRNIVIEGLTIDGHRRGQGNPPPGSIGREDFGMHGVRSDGARDVQIRDVLIRNVVTDGLLISSDKGCAYKRRKNCTATGDTSQGFLVSNVVFHNNGRQGATIAAGDRLTFIDVAFRNTNGISPEAGVDIEPDQPSERVGTVRFIRAEFSGNRGAGLMTDVMGGRLDELVVEDSVFFNNSTRHSGWKVDLQIAGRTKAGSDATIEVVRLERNRIELDVYLGGSGRDGVAAHRRTVLEGNRIGGQIMVARLKMPSSIAVRDSCVRRGVSTGGFPGIVQVGNTTTCSIDLTGYDINPSVPSDGDGELPADPEPPAPCPVLIVRLHAGGEATWECG